MPAEIVENWESFFLQKIKQEFERESKPITSAEQFFLLTFVGDLSTLNLSGAEAKALITRSVGALHRQFLKETSAGSSMAGPSFQSWREQNIQLYRQSRRIISCVVQKWYITLGREQEIKYRRTAMLYTWYSADALKLWDALMHASRIMPRRDPKP